jgi:LPXTG-site transpeptidase (sortase) family protein
MRVPGTSVVSKPRRLVQNRSPLALKPELLRSPRKRKSPKQLICGRWQFRQVLSYCLILVGSALCTFVAATYAWMYVQQRLLLHEWSAERSSLGNPTLTKLSIPKIHLEDVVLEGATRHSLLLGPAHLAGSALPGDPGNAVIAGHRDTFFRHIHSLRYGDDIYILRSGRRFHYVVRARRIVVPTDISVLRSTEYPELTLITCYPTHAIGPAPQRLIVVAKLIGGA